VFNKFTNDIDSHISKTSSIDVGGKVALESIDNPTTVALGGGLAFSGKFGLGASVGANWIQDTITANADDSTITADTSISIDAHDTAKLSTVSIGGAGGGNYAIGGSIGINEIQNTISATATDSNTGDTTHTSL